jgi:hypothetical protein
MPRGGKRIDTSGSSRVLRLKDLPQEVRDQLGLGEEKKVSKYHNRRVVVDGIAFDSQREADRWGELKLMQEAGLIQDLRRQVRFPIVVNEQKICVYVADFVYERDGKTIVEDAKGYRTRVYQLKRALMKACHGLEIRET